MKKLFLLLIGLIIFSSSAFSQSRQVHTVSSGETLYAIARQLDVTVSELREWNSLSSDNLAVGQELVYYMASEIEPLPEPESNPAASLVSISVPQENEYYTVKSGDNLTTIARAHEMTLSELRELNGISGDLLRVGQQLAVRKVQDSVAPSASEYSDRDAPQGSFVIYSVGDNEDKDDLLEKFRMSESELQQLNPEINISALDEGQRITVLLPPSSSYDNPFTASANLQDLGVVTARKYSEAEFGKTTTSGELYNPEKLTAAHSNIAIGSIIYVENPETGSGLYIRINDRITESGLKLSKAAFRILGLLENGNQMLTIYSEN